MIKARVPRCCVVIRLHRCNIDVAQNALCSCYRVGYCPGFLQPGACRNSRKGLGGPRAKQGYAHTCAGCMYARAMQLAAPSLAELRTTCQPFHTPETCCMSHAGRGWCLAPVAALCGRSPRRVRVSWRVCVEWKGCGRSGCQNHVKGDDWTNISQQSNAGRFA